MRPRKGAPPPRRKGRGGGRKIAQELVDAMREVANNPDEWFLVAEYRTRGSASSAAHRMRARDWEEVLQPTRNGRATRYEWDIVSRSYENKEGAGVWAIRRIEKRPE